QPLVSVEAVIALIGSTTTTAGLKVICAKDERTYELGVKVGDEDLARVNIKNEPAYPSWNYSISPRE
ncbi:MAG: ISAzo13 family transposase, partial [Coriobacteriales bacterium]|nr:ISAzo13 family transposase [Coriobacteriales bacterium]